MKSVKKVLLVAESVTLAHSTRMSELHKILTSMDPENQNFEVYLAADSKHRAFISVNDKKFIPINSKSTASFSQALYTLKFPYSFTELQSQLNENEKLIDKVNPDLVISDFRLMMPYSCKKRKIPCVNLVQAHWSEDYPRPNTVPHSRPVSIFGRALSQLLAPISFPIGLLIQKNQINAILKRFKIEPTHSLNDFYTYGDRCWFPDEAYFFDSNFSKNGRFIGCIRWHPDNPELPDWWDTFCQQQKKLFIGLGSSGDHSVVKSINEAAQSKGYAVAVSGGVSDPSYLYWTPHLWFEHALQQSDVIVCNGGTGTTYPSMYFNKTFLAVPSNFDQILHLDAIKKYPRFDYIFPDQINHKNIEKKILKLEKKSKGMPIQTNEVFNCYINQKNILKEELKYFGILD